MLKPHRKMLHTKCSFRLIFFANLLCLWLTCIHLPWCFMHNSKHNVPKKSSNIHIISPTFPCSLIEIFHNLKKMFTFFLAASSHLNYQGRHTGTSQQRQSSRSRLPETASIIRFPVSAWLVPYSPSSCRADVELFSALPHIHRSCLQRR